MIGLVAGDSPSGCPVDSIGKGVGLNVGGKVGRGVVCVWLDTVGEGGATLTLLLLLSFHGSRSVASATIGNSNTSFWQVIKVR